MEGLAWKRAPRILFEHINFATSMRCSRGSINLGYYFKKLELSRDKLLGTLAGEEVVDSQGEKVLSQSLVL